MSFDYIKNKKMKKIKIVIASVLFCAMRYAGYTAYEKNDHVRS